jgi:uncharacterized membrane protein
MRDIHIIAGALSLIAGAVALFAAKGSWLHRKSGLTFVIAMLVMTVSAVIAATTDRPNPGNVVAGTLTFYLVATSLLTIRQDIPQLRALLMLTAFAVGVAGTAVGFAAMQHPDGEIDGIPGPPLLMFAMVAIIGGIGDFRLLRRGGIDGKRRIARHLWRMTYALWIATTSFFIGQAKFIPETLRHWELLVIPPLLVLGMLIYWMIRVLLGKRPATRPPSTREQSERASAR